MLATSPRESCRPARSRAASRHAGAAGEPEGTVRRRHRLQRAAVRVQRRESARLRRRGARSCWRRAAACCSATSRTRRCVAVSSPARPGESIHRAYTGRDDDPPVAWPIAACRRDRRRRDHSGLLATRPRCWLPRLAHAAGRRPARWPTGAKTSSASGREHDGCTAGTRHRRRQPLRRDRLRVLRARFGPYDGRRLQRRARLIASATDFCGLPVVPSNGSQQRARPVAPQRLRRDHLRTTQPGAHHDSSMHAAAKGFQPGELRLEPRVRLAQRRGSASTASSSRTTRCSRS